MPKRTTLARAVEAQPFCGNQSRFAAAIGTSQQNISNWLRLDKCLPAELVLAAEAATGIPRHEWRPDIYPCPHVAVSGKACIPASYHINAPAVSAKDSENSITSEMSVRVNAGDRP